MRQAGGGRQRGGSSARSSNQAALAASVKSAHPVAPGLVESGMRLPRREVPPGERVADVSGMTSRQCQRVEERSVNMTLDAAERLAVGFGVDPVRLLEELPGEGRRW